MLVIYHDRAGAAAAICASVHLGLLPEDAPPTRRQLAAASTPWVRRPGDRGRILVAGIDAAGHRVCVLSITNCVPVLERAIHEVGRHLGVDTADVLFVSADPGLGRIGRPALLLGWRTAYLRLAAVVRRTRTTLDPQPPPEVRATGAG